MNSLLSDKIKLLAAQQHQDVVKIRRDLHQQPELSFQEDKTSSYIQNELKKLAIPFKSGIAGTGVIGTLTGKTDAGRVIALRADMDALPIQEDSDLPFASIHRGVMHACGHDAHTASLLGTARILKELKNEWEGTILLIFQPGEEKYPGGASILLKEGALDNPKPEVVIGQHVLPEMPAGHVGFKKGVYMASADELYLTVTGKGGHAAMPDKFNDTVLAASQIVVSLQQVVSRIVPAIIPTVLSFGRIEGLGTTNIIPQKVKLEGTLRTMDEDWRAILKKKIRSIATSTAYCYGCECTVDIKDGYPMVFNHEETTEKATLLAKQYLSENQVEDMDLRMTAEDFGYYSQLYPSVYYRFGVSQPDNTTGNLHTPNFNLNEKSLETSTGTMAWLAINFLK
ncbi:MAG TPA: M20 family metallopeptidase [Marinilabiliaceae bacterium]|nr:M20 family metallopeptidase [Marinilabiliaceae bacterium]